MRLSFLLLIPVLLGSVLAAGCTSDNPAYCEDDSACTSADAPICHPAKHYCHVRCVTDKDCTDPSHPAFDPPKRVCHVASGHCVGAHDAGPWMRQASKVASRYV